jgi:hypothetical protein
LATGCAALAPFIVYHALFRQLFWFGDEFDLIDQIDRLGFWRWVWTAFAENFVPLFKVLWGGAALGFGGSYAAMIAIVWLTHGLNVALLARVMRTCGLSWTAVFLAQIVFGLAPANCETLAWSVQWSAMLSVAFMLLGLDSIFRSPSVGMPFGWAVASALCFSRGALTGPLIACASFLKATGERLSARIAKAAVFMIPAICVAGLIVLLANGNQHSVGAHLRPAALYALWYLCLNPAHSVLSIESWGWRTTVVLGLLKLVLFGWALLRSRGRIRELFVVLILFDLGNAALLGIGRYHTGITTTVSSRYQYASLIAAMPMAGFWLENLWGRLGGPALLRRIVMASCLAALAGMLCSGWQSALDPFAEWRGARSRQILFEDTNPGPQDVPGIPGLPMDRAKELIAKYHLH